MDTYNLSARQQLADLVVDYGMPKVLLKPYEELLQIKIEKGVASILTRVYEVTERRGSFKVTKSGKRLRVWLRLDDGSWNPLSTEIISWDTNFKSVIIDKYARKSIGEQLDSLEWAKLCDQPGTGKTPLYSYDRVLMTGDGGKSMHKHWGLKANQEEGE